MGNGRVEVHSNKKVWIISEEKPRADVILYILRRLKSDGYMQFPHELLENCSGEICDNVRIRPEIEDGKFMFKYTVEIKMKSKWKALPVYIMLGKGSSNSGGTGSFVDYLVYVSKEKPDPSDVPIYAIETTKTDFTESRNTSVYQRGTKFAFLDIIYKSAPGLKKIMYYHDQDLTGNIPETYKFGMRLYRTIGVEIEPEEVRKFIESQNIDGFSSLDELEKAKEFSKAILEVKNALDTPVGIKLVKTDCGEVIILSAKLEKSDNLAHDPNIGLVSLVGEVVHRLSDGKVPVIVVFHGLKENMIKSNKLVLVASEYNIYLADTKYRFVPRDKIEKMTKNKNGNPVNNLMNTLSTDLDNAIKTKVTNRTNHKINTSCFNKTNWKLLIGSAREALIEVLAEDIVQACKSCNSPNADWKTCLKGIVMDEFEKQKRKAKQRLAKAVYWQYDEKSEKNATILLHVLTELASSLEVIFHNHGGSELAYLVTPEDEHVQVPKKKGIPDLIVADHDKKILWILEGKARTGNKNLIKGINQLFSDRTREFIETKLKNTGNYCHHEIRFGMVFFDPNHSLDKTLKWITRTLQEEIEKDEEFKNDKVKNLDFIFVLSNGKKSNEGEIGVLVHKEKLLEFIDSFREIVGGLMVEYIEKDHQKRLFE